MDNQLFIAVLAGLGGMFGWGFAELGTKKSVDKIGTVSSLVWAHLFGIFILLAFIIVRYFIFGEIFFLPVSTDEWLGLIFFGALQALVYYFAFKGFEKGQLSILSPIFASFAGLVAIVSILFFGEIVSLGLVFALAVVFVGIIILNTDAEHLKLGKFKLKGVPGLKEVLIATVLATIWTLGWDRFSEGKDWLMLTTLMFVFLTLTAYIIAIFHKINLTEAKPGVWPFLWLIAFGETVAYLAITYGYSLTTYTSVVAVLSGALSLPTIVLAHMFLGERFNKYQAYGCALIIFGIMALALA